MIKSEKRNLKVIWVDDVFVREDLYHGKYAPDYEAVRRLMEREERAEKMEL